MLHITETGMFAGRPICGCDKQARTAEGDTFSHLPYSRLADFLANADLCPDCKAEFDAAMEEGDES